MKTIYLPTMLLVCLLLFSSTSYSQHEFITTWKTDNSGTSSDTEITIPVSGNSHSYDVDWDNNGVFDEFGLTGSVTHDFGKPGTYTIRIQGDFPNIHFNGGGDRLKILSVDQWGTIAWTGFSRAFNDCGNLVVNAIDAPDLSNVTSLSFAFAGCNSLTGDFSSWDVSNVVNMSFMFIDAHIFNCDLSEWNTSSVTSMRSMFDYAKAFDQNLGAWNIELVSDMENMFVGHSGLSTRNYDKTIIGWSKQAVKSDIIFDAGASDYCHSEAAREFLINEKGWTINDGESDYEGNEFIKYLDSRCFRNKNNHTYYGYRV